ncbi:MAG TPA: hypothetical protein VLV83_26215 [Acidobacteriota bacterium]|nr:hypothetical protein [Acidobacteriota bacterium]
MTDVYSLAISAVQYDDGLTVTFRGSQSGEEETYRLAGRWIFDRPVMDGEPLTEWMYKLLERLVHDFDTYTPTEIEVRGAKQMQEDLPNA